MQKRVAVDQRRAPSYRAQTFQLPSPATVMNKLDVECGFPHRSMSFWSLLLLHRITEKRTKENYVQQFSGMFVCPPKLNSQDSSTKVGQLWKRLGHESSALMGIIIPEMDSCSLSPLHPHRVRTPSVDSGRKRRTAPHHKSSTFHPPQLSILYKLLNPQNPVVGT